MQEESSQPALGRAGPRCHQEAVLRAGMAAITYNRHEAMGQGCRHPPWQPCRARAGGELPWHGCKQAPLAPLSHRARK